MATAVVDNDRAFKVVDVRQTMRNVILTVHLAGAQRYRWQCRLATQLICLAAYVMGCRCKVTVGMEDDG